MDGRGTTYPVQQRGDGRRRSASERLRGTLRRQRRRKGSKAKKRFQPLFSRQPSNSGAAVTSQALASCEHQRRDTGGAPHLTVPLALFAVVSANETSVYFTAGHSSSRARLCRGVASRIGIKKSKLSDVPVARVSCRPLGPRGAFGRMFGVQRSRADHDEECLLFGISAMVNSLVGR